MHADPHLYRPGPEGYLRSRMRAERQGIDGRKAQKSQGALNHTKIKTVAVTKGNRPIRTIPPAVPAIPAAIPTATDRTTLAQPPARGDAIRAGAIVLQKQHL